MDAMTDAGQKIGVIRSRGLRFPDDPGVLSPKIRRMLRAKNYETREFEAVRALVRPEDSVMELGAGIGFMSTVAAVRCGAKSVQTFEANPRLIPYIEQVHALNGAKNARVTNALLGAKKGKPVDFHIRQNLLASSLEPMQGKTDGGVIAVEKVPVLNINTVIKEIRPTVLICDIEGAEAELLPKASFAGLRLAIIELHPQWIGQDGVQGIFDSMHKAGLTYFPWRSNKKVVTFRKDW